ncbi:MAG: tetratricopeptide repeat protein [Candidatus Zixiibacteriota bacterium]|nr:MAG: tetratricopeptide repeat protein [candidate division Zixibacteria bacterium]
MGQQTFRKRFLLWTVISMATLIFAAGCGEKETATPTGIAFITEYSQALDAAALKDQPVLIDFYAKWCKWCKTLDTITFIDSAVIALSQNMVFAKIDGEEDTITARKYGVPQYPTLVLTTSDGTEIDRIGGYLAPEEFLETIENYLNGVGTLDYYLNLPDSEVTIEATFAIAEKYADRGKYEEAESYYQTVIGEDPDNNDGFTDEAMMAVGNILRRNEKYPEAIAQFAEVIKKYEGEEAAEDAEIWTAICYRQKGDTATAIEYFENFVKNHPESPDTTYALSQIEKLKNPPPPEEDTE